MLRAAHLRFIILLKNGNFDSPGAALTRPLTPFIPTADTTASQGKDESPQDTDTTFPVSGQTSMSLTRLECPCVNPEAIEHCPGAAAQVDAAARSTFSSLMPRFQRSLVFSEPNLSLCLLSLNLYHITALLVRAIFQVEGARDTWQGAIDRRIVQGQSSQPY